MISCTNSNTSNEGATETKTKFTYFDNKTYTLDSLETELCENWLSSFDKCYRCTIVTGSNGELSNFALNASIQGVLNEQGSKFAYDMSVKNKVWNMDIIDLLESVGAWEKSMYAVCDFFQSEPGTHIGGALYFEHFYWNYDGWKYNGGGDYSWKASDVGKQIISSLSSYNNENYEIYSPSVLVNKGNWDDSNYIYSGETYLSVMVMSNSNKRKAYQIFKYNMKTKTISSYKAISDWDYWDWLKEQNLEYQY